MQINRNSNTVNYIERYNKRNEHCLAVFLDIAAAFDAIKPHHIKEMLLEKEVDVKIVEWYYKYITEQHLTLEANEYKIRTCVEVGFPQGGVCSAKCWIIAFDPAIEITKENGIFDCTALIGGGPQRNEHKNKQGPGQTSHCIVLYCIVFQEVAHMYIVQSQGERALLGSAP